MFALLKKYSIRVQLLCLGITILLLLAVTAAWGYNRILNITYKRNTDYTTEMIAAIKQSVASNVDSINRILPNIAYNDLVQQYLLEDDRLAQYELNTRIEKLFVNLQSMKQGIMGVVLLGEGISSYNCVGCRDFIPFGEIPLRTSAYYTGVHYSPYYKSDVMYVGVPVYDIRTTAPSEKRIGYAVMVLDLQAIAPKLDGLSKTIAGQFYVLDRNRAVAISNDASTVGRPLPPAIAKRVEENGPSGESARSEDGAFVVREEGLPEIGGTIVSVFPVEELFRGLEDVQRLLLGMLLLLVAVMYAFYIAISRNILYPIRSFMTFIYSLRAKGLDHKNKRVSLEGYSEITIMARQFNSLLDEIDDLAAKLIDSKTHIFELQLLKKQAELQFLKSQINPHFLYNTLETIKGIAYAKGVPEIREMTDSLGRIFRYSVKGGEVVLLREEIETVEAYVRIQQVRFANRFEFANEFDETLRETKVIKMILQPLVENAVFHGIEPCLHPCRLTVGCRLDEGGDLLLWVADDGAGMDPAMLDGIRRSLAEPPSSHDLNAAPQRHIGILNVNNRIRFAYGGEYGIVSIESAADRGTTVTVKLPAKEGVHHV
ncbi:sensor histidine kinase [Paenibacillus flagellatus]|uniref:HAMP domain-containing protein n=1 Tax=Paenibacillus flagellatus TaxID=2211139 RepID=A0A2V5KP11_9BACL|nr:sensor histidine kinase [Paenibacillus flagellatus]PYI57110.1 hypothetical protein DLM86_01300 [Paenibacillus flagellatus]